MTGTLSADRLGNCIESVRNALMNGNVVIGSLHTEFGEWSNLQALCVLV